MVNAGCHDWDVFYPTHQNGDFWAGLWHWVSHIGFCSGLATCFSQVRSKGSRFALGVWELRVCSLDVAPPSATVLNRSQPSV